MIKKILILVLFANLFLHAQPYPDKMVDSLIKKGLSDVIKQDYKSAKKTFHDLDVKYPSLPLGKIYYVGAYIAETYDMAEEFNSDLIYNELEDAIEQSEKLIDAEPGNIWNHYFLAVAKGQYAYYEALTEDWLGALSDGFSAVSNFEKCLDINSSFYESYTAIGTYMYWKSRKTEFLNWLPFVEDEREEGIAYLKKAVQKSSYTYYHAIYSLQWIFVDMGKPQEAVKISQKALKDYPESRFFKWGYARALQDINKEDAIKVYYEILNSYPEKTNRFNEILIKYIIAQLYQKLNKPDKAIALCDEILAVNGLSEYVKEKLGDRIEKVRELRQYMIESRN